MVRSFLCLICFFYILANTDAANHALIFGLGKQEDSSWGKIHGDRDVELVSEMLVDAGFTDIRIVVNEQATKLGMEAAFLGLISRCQSGDIVYIHYSGHGQLMSDINGDEAERWTGIHSQWDEAWIPYDAYMNYCEEDRGDKHFCDDEIAEYLTHIRQRIGPTGQIYVVVDACHSGDATRGKDDDCIRGVDTKFVIPLKNGKKKVSHLEEKWLTISACKPFQLCFEQKNPPAGKLTVALSVLGKEMFKMNNEALQKWLKQYMEEHPSRVSQDPVVSGKK